MEASELISRLQDGRGSAPRLDIDLCEYFQLAPKEFFGSKVEKYSWENGWITTADGILHTDALKPSPLVSDLNAVFALVERERPNAVVQISNLPQHFWGVTVESGGATHSDLTRAMLLALLAAKEQQP